MKQIDAIDKQSMKDEHPDFNPGDTIKVHVKIKEGDKERIQVFQGIVIGRRGSGIGETFTVRKMSSGIGVERVFPFHSPNIAKIEKMRSGSGPSREAVLPQNLTGKSARIEEDLDALTKEQAHK